MKSPPASDETKAAKGAQGRERRRSPCYPCEGFVEGMLVHPESMFRGQVLDISQSGCLVVTRACIHLESQAEVDLRIRLNGNTYRTRARIVSLRPEGGVAIEFTLATAEIAELFTNLIWTLSLGVLPK